MKTETKQLLMECDMWLQYLHRYFWHNKEYRDSQERKDLIATMKKLHKEMGVE